MKNLKSFWQDFGSDISQSVKYVFSSSIPVTLKIIPVAVILYILSPIDVVPDGLIGVGILDDSALFFLGLKIFLSLAEKSVRESKKRKTSVFSDEVIEGEVVEE